MNVPLALRQVDAHCLAAQSLNSFWVSLLVQKLLLGDESNQVCQTRNKFTFLYEELLEVFLGISTLLKGRSWS